MVMMLTENAVVYDGEMNEYLLKKSIGFGGFGIVYLATRKTDSAVFAVKVLNPFTAKEESVRSFKNEIKLAQQVSSPHIIHYEFMHDGSVYQELPPYIIMEYAPDGTLQEVIENARISNTHFTLDTIISIFTQLINGMEVLNKTIIHRDIKPENILRFASDYKISDFGISKIVNEYTRTLTFKGFGSKYYFAPEAWNSEKNTIQMDIYSMGIVFYEIATLQYPYEVPENPDDNQLRLMHLTSPVKKALLSTTIPQYLVSTILLMLEKDTQKRFKTWNEVRETISRGQSLLDPSIQNLVERAIQQTNATEIAIQERKAIEQRKKEIDNEYCALLNSQFYNSIYAPIQEFAKAYNSTNPNSKKMKITYLNSNNTINYVTFMFTTPFGTDIEFFFEIPTLTFLEYPKSILDSFYINRETLGKLPKVNSEAIIAWGIVRSDYQTGFNVILTFNPAQDTIYGNWHILENSNSSIAHTGVKRVSPFGFTLDELPKEIQHINSTHIYSTKVLDFSIDYIHSFISNCMSMDLLKYK